MCLKWLVSRWKNDFSYFSPLTRYEQVIKVIKSGLWNKSFKTRDVSSHVTYNLELDVRSGQVMRP